MNLNKIIKSSKPYKTKDELKNFFADQWVPANAKKHGVPKLKSGENALRIVSYNIHFHTTYRESKPLSEAEFNKGVSEAIKNLDPDILVLEEVCSPENVVSKKDYPHIVFMPVQGGPGSLGNAICSKIPLQDVETVFYRHDALFPKVEPRGYIAATVEPKAGCKIRIYATHLDVFDGTGQTRCIEIEELQEAIKKCNVENVCVIGDFNALLRSDYDAHHWKWILKQDEGRGQKTVTNAMNVITDKLKYRDAFAESKLSQGVRKSKNVKPPSVTTWSLRRIDYIMLAPSFKLPIANSMVLYTAASDHLPIGIDIDLSAHV